MSPSSPRPPRQPTFPEPAIILWPWTVLYLLYPVAFLFILKAYISLNYKFFEGSTMFNYVIP